MQQIAARYHMPACATFCHPHRAPDCFAVLCAPVKKCFDGDPPTAVLASSRCRRAISSRWRAKNDEHSLDRLGSSIDGVYGRRFAVWLSSSQCHSRRCSRATVKPAGALAESVGGVTSTPHHATAKHGAGPARTGIRFAGLVVMQFDAGCTCRACNNRECRADGGAAVRSLEDCPGRIEHHDDAHRDPGDDRLHHVADRRVLDRSWL
jgi:hypothetical protein